MAPHSSSRSHGISIERCLRAPLRKQSYRNLVYLSVIFPLGVVYFTLLFTGVVVGLAHSIILVGIPILLFLPVVAVGLAGFERALIRALVGVDVPSPDSVDADADLVGQFKRLLTDRGTWTAFFYLFSEFVYGSLVFGLLMSVGATAGSFLLAPFYYQRTPVVAHGPLSIGQQTLSLMFGWDTLLVGLTTTFQIGSWKIETLSGALAFAGVGFVLLFLLFQLANLFAWLWVQYARVMLQTQRYWSPVEWAALTPW